MGLLSSLQQQQAEALVRHDLLISTTRADDPRLAQVRREIGVIEDRIAQEQSKLGLGEGSASGAVYADLMGEFESLTVDRTFAEEAYVAALTGLDLARAEARRQSRYLAAHVAPTLAERAQYPQREIILGVIVALTLLGWGFAVLVVKSLADRR